jgi:hypothetical protein
LFNKSITNDLNEPKYIAKRSKDIANNLESWKKNSSSRTESEKFFSCKEYKEFLHLC